MSEDWAARFAANLSALIASTGLTKKEVAEGAGVDYKWLRRISSKGLKRRNKRSADDLDRLASWFGVTDFELWRSEPDKIVVDSCFAEEWPTDPSIFCERFKTLCPRQYWLLVEIARTEEKMLQRVEVALSLSEPKSVAGAWRYFILNRSSVVFEKPWEQGESPYAGSEEAEMAYSQLVGGPSTTKDWYGYLYGRHDDAP